MLDNFKAVYDKELNIYYGDATISRLLLNSTEVRQFVYEICKHFAHQPAVAPDKCQVEMLISLAIANTKKEIEKLEKELEAI